MPPETVPIATQAPPPAGIPPCPSFCGAPRLDGGADTLTPPPSPPGGAGSTSTAPRLAATVTRPYTLEPIQRSLEEAATEFALELEGEGNLPEEVSYTTVELVTKMLNDQYGPEPIRQALLAVIGTIH